MARNTPNNPIGVGRSLAASVAVTGALISAGATKDFTVLDIETPKHTVVVPLGTEVTYSAAGAPESVELNLGMGNDNSKASGEYAKKFAEDPAALRISQENIDQAAQTILSLNNVGVVQITGWASDEDDQAKKGYEKPSVKNLLLAERRGMVATQMLQEALQKLGSNVQVEYLGGVENLLTPEEHLDLIEVTDALTTGEETQDDLETILDRMTDMYNADHSSVPESLTPLFTKLLDEQRGAGLKIPFTKSELTEMGKLKENCIVVTKSGTMEYPAKKSGGITFTGFLPIPIILRRRRKDSDPLSRKAVDQEAKIEEITSELREVVEDMRNPYFVHADGVPEASCVRLPIDTVEGIRTDIEKSRKLRGKILATPLPIRAIGGLSLLTYFITPLNKRAFNLYASTIDRNVDKEVNAYKERAAKTPRTFRKHKQYDRRLKVVMIPLSLVVIGVSIPQYYGSGADKNGCETTSFAPNGYKPWTSEEECKQIAEDEKFNIRPRIGIVTDFSEPEAPTPEVAAPPVNIPPASVTPPIPDPELPLTEQSCIAEHPDAVATRYEVRDQVIEPR